MPTEQTLAVANNKIWSDIKFEMDKQGYTTTSLAKLLNVNRPTLQSMVEPHQEMWKLEKIYHVLGME